MTELIICPNCKKPTVKSRRIIPPKLPPVEISLEDYAKREVEKERKADPWSLHITSSDILEFPKAVQLVFECSTCGYTKVYDV